MRKLSGTDALFLYSETPNTPQHVGSIQYFEVAPERRECFFRDYRAQYSERVHLLPYLTNRLVMTPWGMDHPVWVRHEAFDINEHVHHVTVDQPGNIDQVESLCSELYEKPLDRNKPLWETWVIDGLENGQVAILNKTHHACYDGMASVTATEVINDYTPTPRTVDPAPSDFWYSEDTGPTRLMRETWLNLTRYNLEHWIKWPQRMRAGQRAAWRSVRSPRRTMMAAPKAPWNAAITSKRRVAGTAFSLATMKAISKQTGTKINDVVLAITSEALRRYLKRQNRSVGGKLIAGCPVSLRKPNNTEMNNQVSMLMVSLENQISDPVKRLQSIHQETKAAKAMHADVRDSVESDFGAPFWPAMAQNLARATQSGAYANFATQVPVSLVVSNVPGVREPLYAVGAKLVGTTPISIVTHGSGLNVTVTSYMDRFDLGLTAATSVVPDVEGLRDDFVAAYHELIERTIGEPVSVVDSFESQATIAERVEAALDSVVDAEGNYPATTPAKDRAEIKNPNVVVPA